MSIVKTITLMIHLTIINCQVAKIPALRLGFRVVKMARTKKMMVYGDQSYQRLRPTIVVLLFLSLGLFFIFIQLCINQFYTENKLQGFLWGREGGGIARYVCYTDFDSILSNIVIGLIDYLFIHKLYKIQQAYK